MNRRLRAAWIAASIGAAAAAVVVFGRIEPPVQGLEADYFRSADWTLPVRHVSDEMPTRAAAAAAWGGSPPSAFSVVWSGSFLALRDDTYTVSTTSDDGSFVSLDGRTVVDNGGRHGAATVVAPIRLRRGAHPIVVKYFQDGGGFDFELRIVRGRDPVPAWTLVPPRTSFAGALLRVAVASMRPAASAIGAMALFALALVASWPWLCKAVAHLVADRIRGAMFLILTGSFVLNAWEIWWGLPGYGWAGDELTPPTVLGGLAQRFAGGWFTRWPPAHFYVLALAYAPLLAAERIGRFTLSGAWQYTVLLFVSRVVSLAAATATAWFVYAIAARAFSRRAGVFAALSFALLVPFVYYAKTANIDCPLAFWVALSLLMLFRVLRTLALADYVLFASTAALAVCTKDQAYAVYIAPPLLIAAAEWQRARSACARRPLLHAIVNRRMLAAVVCAAAVFAACHNLLFNFRGFVSHVRYITGAGSEGYRMFAPTWRGQLQLLIATLRVDASSWGYPLSAAAACGLVFALRERQTRRAAVALAAIAVSYYAGFIGVVLYVYDRFLFPVFIVQAVFAGVACDRLVAWAPRRIAAGALAALFGYSLLYAGTVDVLMARDARYAAERWIAHHVARGELVATMFGVQYLPRLDNVSWAVVRSGDELVESRAPFYLLNADYARALDPATEPGQLVSRLRDGTLGYEVAFRCRAAAPWPWLPGGHPDLVGERLDLPVLTVLRNVNPTIEIYRRKPLN